MSLKQALCRIGPRTQAALGAVFVMAAAYAGPYAYQSSRVAAERVEDGFDCDAIIVPTGDGSRIVRGIEMQRRYANSVLFISGVNMEVSFHELREAIEDVNPHAHLNSRTTLGYRAQDTKGNAEEIAQWLARHPDIRRIIVVTSDLHEERMRLQLHQALARFDNPPEIRFVSSGERLSQHPGEATIQLLDEVTKTAASFYFEAYQARAVAPPGQEDTPESAPP